KLKQGTILPGRRENAALTKAALADPDTQLLTAEQFAAMRPARGRGRSAGVAGAAQAGSNHFSSSTSSKQISTGLLPRLSTPSQT
ncbi:hypothetical protein ABTE23_20745, partial [Acinetobacter baumannii]